MFGMTRHMVEKLKYQLLVDHADYEERSTCGIISSNMLEDDEIATTQEMRLPEM
ncbi:hypothetical protein LSTR_LSTR006227, partial [Laodelphax striatellus]